MNPKKKSDSKSKSTETKKLSAKAASPPPRYPSKITRDKQAEEALRQSEERYRGLFEHSPVSLWEEDFSAVKQRIEAWKQQGVTDFREFFVSHPDELVECIAAIRVLDVNQATLKIMEATDKEQITGGLERIVHKVVDPSFRNEFISIAAGETEFAWEGINYTLKGKEILVSLNWSAAPGYEDTLEKVLVSMQDITERKQAEQAQQQSEFLFRALFEASPDAVMLIDPHDPNEFGPIIDCNAAGCLMNGYRREELIGHSIDILNKDPFSPAMIIGYLKKIRESGILKYETFHRHKNGTLFPVEVSTTLIKVGERELLIGIDRDITERKRTEAELQASGEAKRIFGERLTILSEVTTELSKADSLDALCRRAVELGRERLDFDRLAIWFLAEDRTTMRGTFGVDTDGRITDEHIHSLILSEDYPSRSVIQDQIPLLHRKDAQLALMGQPVGRGEHVTAGLWDGNAVIGYISVDNLLRQRPFGDHDCEIIRLYATAVGHLISLKRTEMELQASRATEQSFGERLIVLSETTTELSKAASLDALCRRAVELGRERLDFDRLSIFFLSEDSNSILGTFGVDAEGRITDERGDRYPIGPESNIRSILQSQIPLLRLTDVPLALKGQEVGQGTHVFAGLWDGSTAIGYISVDNLLRHRPISERDCEIIRLYASALGHLCSLKRAQEELRTSEERFTKSFQSNPIATMIETLPEWRLLDVNRTFLHLTGYSREEVIGKTEPELNLWENPEDRSRFVRGLIEHKSLQNIESQLLTKSGESRYILASAEIIEIAGQPHSLMMLSDITERKHNELVQNAIYRITQAAITSEGIDELYHSIHSILGELIPTENFFIALIEPVSKLINFPYYIDQYDEPPVGMNPQQGLTGYIIRTGRPLLATRQEIENLVRQGLVERLGSMSVDWMGAPLKVEGRMIGVMAVQSYTDGIHFHQEDLNLLEFVSTQVAQAIERKRMEEEIRNLSLTDELTGLYNRRGFTLLAEQEVKLAHRIKRSMLLLFGDVDNLKTINDAYGHSQGNQALQEISAILKETFRESDLVARIGGDEFVVLAVDASMESGDVLTHRIQSLLEKGNQQGDRPYQLSLSMGIAHYDPESPCTLDELIAQADGVMYQQKQERHDRRQKTGDRGIENRE